MLGIDQVNLYESIGLEKIKELSRSFYTKVYADKDPEFRGMFPDDMEMAIRNQYEFFADTAYFMQNVNDDGSRIY